MSPMGAGWSFFGEDGLGFESQNQILGSAPVRETVPKERVPEIIDWNTRKIIRHGFAPEATKLSQFKHFCRGQPIPNSLYPFKMNNMKMARILL